MINVELRVKVMLAFRLYTNRKTSVISIYRSHLTPKDSEVDRKPRGDKCPCIFYTSML